MRRSFLTLPRTRRKEVQAVLEELGIFKAEKPPKGFEKFGKSRKKAAKAEAGKKEAQKVESSNKEAPKGMKYINKAARLLSLNPLNFRKWNKPPSIFGVVHYHF